MENMLNPDGIYAVNQNGIGTFIAKPILGLDGQLEGWDDLQFPLARAAFEDDRVLDISDPINWPMISDLRN